MLQILSLPLLFSILGAGYVSLNDEQRRPQALLAMVLFQVVGSIAYTWQPGLALFALLTLHAAVAAALMTYHAQSRPLLAPSKD
ncbi:hypothetical protein SAMN00790413_06456 [Deinococcus hopiensis KR-140]|uniref:Uncharacterized protein n=2 Tax=Deinococcus TaxID=1298 RepID=A0A1W1VV57_9DEIO|nr:hypothetical protein SAMN00790413_06456 [Deinococcus hopiensis KR-140]